MHFKSVLRWSISRDLQGQSLKKKKKNFTKSSSTTWYWTFQFQCESGIQHWKDFWIAWKKNATAGLIYLHRKKYLSLLFTIRIFQQKENFSTEFLNFTGSVLYSNDRLSVRTKNKTRIYGQIISPGQWSALFVMNQWNWELSLSKRTCGR